MSRDVPSIEPPTQVTRRRSADVIESVMTGRAARPLLIEMGRDFEALGNARIWFIDTTGVTGYTADAVAGAVELFVGRRKAGLERIVAIVTSGLIRMGASAVAVGSGMDLRMVASMREAEAHLR